MAVVAGMGPAVACTAVAIGMAAAGMVGAVAGIMVVTVAVGELDPQ